MNTKKWMSIGLALSLILVFSSCKKEKCAGDQGFCAALETENYTETMQVMNTFLGTTSGDNSSRLEGLNDYLACKSCLTSSVILCNSCILTLPEQSEIQINFSANGVSKQLVFDVSMGTELRVTGYHE